MTTATPVEKKLQTVVALRRYNPGLSRGNRAALEPIFEGEKIHPLWNLIAPPIGDFRIATLWDGDHAGVSPISPNKNTYTGHPDTAKGRNVSGKDLIETEGLKEYLVKSGLVKI